MHKTTMTPSRFSLATATVLAPSALVLTATLTDSFSTLTPPPTKPSSTTTSPPKSIRDLPAPFKWPILGTLPDFLQRGGIDRLPEIYQDMYQEYGSVYGMSILGNDELIVCDPNVYDSIVRKEGKFPVGGAEDVSTFTEYYKENNLTMAMKGVTNGPEWKEWRDALNPDMFAAWASYLPVIAETARKISDVAGYEVTETKNIQFVDFISRSAFDMFESVMYGRSPETTNSKVALPEDVEFVKASQTAFDITGTLLSNPLEKVFEGELYKKFVVNMDKTFRFAREKTKKFADLATLEQQQQQQQSQPFYFADDISSTSSAAESSGCPIQKMKNAIPTTFPNPSFVQRIVHRGQLANEDIAELGAPLLMAGVDTTAYVMSWLYLNLASNPSVQTKLAHELQTVLQGKDLTTVEQMESLPYLKACIRESHRLTPPAPVAVKKLKQDVDVTIPTTGETYRIKAGQRISLNLKAYPLDAQYVSNPTQYQPERFLPSAIESRKGTPAEIIDHPHFIDPFGRGKRRCLGGSVATAEIMILAARLIQDWEIRLADESQGRNWTAKQKLLLKADPYPEMKVIKREKVEEGAWL